MQGNSVTMKGKWKNILSRERERERERVRERNLFTTRMTMKEHQLYYIS